MLHILLLWLLAVPAFGAPLAHNAAEGEPPSGGDFSLVGPEGRQLPLAAFRGSAVLLYFGYTRCPDVCPMGLESIKRIMGSLGGEAASVQPLFVTLDPGHDRGGNFQSYLRYYHPRLIGLTGSEEAVAAVAGRYGVRYRRYAHGSASGDQIAHTDHLYLLDREGRLKAVYDSYAAPAEVAATLRELIAVP